MERNVGPEMSVDGVREIKSEREWGSTSFLPSTCSSRTLTEREREGGREGERSVEIPGARGEWRGSASAFSLRRAECVGRGDGKQDTYVGVGGVRTRRGRSKVPEVIIVSRFSPDCEAERTSERERERERTREALPFSPSPSSPFQPSSFP
jgi:hypothetical protein